MKALHSLQPALHQNILMAAAYNLRYNRTNIDAFRLGPDPYDPESQSYQSSPMQYHWHENGYREWINMTHENIYYTMLDYPDGQNEELMTEAARLFTVPDPENAPTQPLNFHPTEDDE